MYANYICSQCHACWLPGDARSQSIISHDIGLSFYNIPVSAPEGFEDFSSGLSICTRVGFSVQVVVPLANEVSSNILILNKPSVYMCVYVGGMSTKMPSYKYIWIHMFKIRQTCNYEFAIYFTFFNNPRWRFGEQYQTFRKNYAPGSLVIQHEIVITRHCFTWT